MRHSLNWRGWQNLQSAELLNGRAASKPGGLGGGTTPAPSPLGSGSSPAVARFAMAMSRIPTTPSPSRSASSSYPASPKTRPNVVRKACTIADKSEGVLPAAPPPDVGSERVVVSPEVWVVGLEPPPPKTRTSDVVVISPLALPPLETGAGAAALPPSSLGGWGSLQARPKASAAARARRNHHLLIPAPFPLARSLALAANDPHPPTSGPRPEQAPFHRFTGSTPDGVTSGEVAGQLRKREC